MTDPQPRGIVQAMRALIAALATVTALSLAGSAGAATTKTVNIYSFFSPKTVTITAGDTVRWVNRDNDRHQVYGAGGTFVSPILKPKETYSFTFNAAGTYTYHDELFPKMTGTVVVKGAPPTVTLAASATYTVAGDPVTLSGVVSNRRAGEQVTIFYQPYPQPNPIERTVVLTTSGGVYRFTVAPGILTTYQATWKGAFAPPADVITTVRWIRFGAGYGW